MMEGESYVSDSEEEEKMNYLVLESDRRMELPRGLEVGETINGEQVTTTVRVCLCMVQVQQPSDQWV